MYMTELDFRVSPEQRIFEPKITVEVSTDTNFDQGLANRRSGDLK
jgi:hypothetical protein